MKVKGQKLKICAKKARAANKRRVAFFPKIATRRIYFIHIFRQLLVSNLSKSEKKSSVLALVPYYTDYSGITNTTTLEKRPLMDIHDIILASRAEQSYSTRARWALRAIRKYLRLGLAPSWRYKILHAHARAIFSTALKAAVISIYLLYKF